MSANPAIFFVGKILITVFLVPMLAAAQPPKTEHSPQAWERKIQDLMLAQDFQTALAQTLEAQQQYPEQRVFRDYEASIREYLQAKRQLATQNEIPQDSRDSGENQLKGVYQNEPDRPSLRERLVAAAKLDPLLELQGGIGLKGANSLQNKAANQAALGPFTQAAMRLYFSPNIGVELFYYDSHWNLRELLKNLAGQNLASIVWGGSLRFRNKFSPFFDRGSMSFALDIGVGLYDMFTVLQNYAPRPIIVLGFSFSSRPFYHFGGIEALAGLQLDLGFSLFLNMQSDAVSIVETGNAEVVVWQSFGIFRLGLSYRGSLSEYYKQKQIFWVQHQFSLLTGLEWRTSFQ